MESFCVHYQTWKNEKALIHVLETFRKFFKENKIRVVSDAGNDYSHLKEIYQIDFEWYEINTLPKGKMKDINACYEWLKRLFDTCILYDSEWVVIFEDDVLTQSKNIKFPKEDSGGFTSWPWNPGLTSILKNRNSKNKLWGYGMSGGSIFKREAFVNSYSRIHEFDLNYLSIFDNRIITHSDTLINCFLQYFGYSYEIWSGIGDMTYPGIEVSNEACFVHGYKELY